MAKKEIISKTLIKIKKKGKAKKSLNKHESTKSYVGQGR